MKLRGEIHSSSGGDAFLDSLVVAVVSVNGGVPEVLQIRKNKYSTVLTLEPGANTVEVAIEADLVVISQSTQVYYYIPVSGTERLVVTLEWGSSFTKPSDFDLHLIGPHGDDCYYGNANPDWGVPGNPDDDPMLLADVTEGGGFSMVSEVIQTTDPAPGTYHVRVHFFDDFADARPVFTAGISQSRRRHRNLLHTRQWGRYGRGRRLGGGDFHGGRRQCAQRRRRCLQRRAPYPSRPRALLPAKRR